DFLRPAEAAEWDRGHVLGARAVDERLGQTFGLYPAGCDRVDRNPVRADLAGKRLRPADHARAHRVRQREVVERLAHRARPDVDDPSVAAAAEVGEAELR